MTKSFTHLQLTFLRLFRYLRLGLACGLFALMAAGGIGGTAVLANEGLETDFARAELLSAVDATGDLDEIQLGLQVSLQPGWKIYWRSPGDAGLPTRLILSEGSPVRADTDNGLPDP